MTPEVSDDTMILCEFQRWDLATDKTFIRAGLAGEHRDRSSSDDTLRLIAFTALGLMSAKGKKAVMDALSLSLAGVKA